MKFLSPPIARLLLLVKADGRARKDIATACGMSESQFSQVLTGHRAGPSVVTVGRILSGLGKRWADLDSPNDGGADRV